MYKPGDALRASDINALIEASGLSVSDGVTGKGGNAVFKDVQEDTVQIYLLTPQSEKEIRYNNPLSLLSEKSAIYKRIAAVQGEEDAGRFLADKVSPWPFAFVGGKEVGVIDVMEDGHYPALLTSDKSEDEFTVIGHASPLKVDPVTGYEIDHITKGKVIYGVPSLGRILGFPTRVYGSVPYLVMSTPQCQAWQYYSKRGKREETNLDTFLYNLTINFLTAEGVSIEDAVSLPDDLLSFRYKLVRERQVDKWQCIAKLASTFEEVDAGYIAVTYPSIRLQRRYGGPNGGEGPAALLALERISGDLDEITFASKDTRDALDNLLAGTDICRDAISVSVLAIPMVPGKKYHMYAYDMLDELKVAPEDKQELPSVDMLWSGDSLVPSNLVDTVVNELGKERTKDLIDAVKKDLKDDLEIAPTEDAYRTEFTQTRSTRHGLGVSGSWGGSQHIGTKQWKRQVSRRKKSEILSHALKNAGYSGLAALTVNPSGFSLQNPWSAMSVPFAVDGLQVNIYGNGVQESYLSAMIYHMNSSDKFVDIYELYGGKAGSREWILAKFRDDCADYISSLLFAESRTTQKTLSGYLNSETGEFWDSTSHLIYDGWFDIFKGDSVTENKPGYLYMWYVNEASPYEPSSGIYINGGFIIDGRFTEEGSKSYYDAFVLSTSKGMYGEPIEGSESIDVSDISGITEFSNLLNGEEVSAQDESEAEPVPTVPTQMEDAPFVEDTTNDYAGVISSSEGTASDTEDGASVDDLVDPALISDFSLTEVVYNPVPVAVEQEAVKESAYAKVILPIGPRLVHNDVLPNPVGEVSRDNYELVELPPDEEEPDPTVPDTPAPEGTTGEPDGTEPDPDPDSDPDPGPDPDSDSEPEPVLVFQYVGTDTTSVADDEFKYPHGDGGKIPASFLAAKSLGLIEPIGKETEPVLLLDKNGRKATFWNNGSGPTLYLRRIDVKEGRVTSDDDATVSSRSGFACYQSAEFFSNPDMSTCGWIQYSYYYPDSTEQFTEQIPSDVLMSPFSVFESSILSEYGHYEDSGTNGVVKVDDDILAEIIVDSEAGSATIIIHPSAFPFDPYVHFPFYISDKKDSSSVIPYGKLLGFTTKTAFAHRTWLPALCRQTDINEVLVPGMILEYEEEDSVKLEVTYTRDDEEHTKSVDFAYATVIPPGGDSSASIDTGTSAKQVISDVAYNTSLEGTPRISIYQMSIKRPDPEDELVDGDYWITKIEKVDTKPLKVGTNVFYYDAIALDDSGVPKIREPFGAFNDCENTGNIAVFSRRDPWGLTYSLSCRLDFIPYGYAVPTTQTACYYKSANDNCSPNSKSQKYSITRDDADYALYLKGVCYVPGATLSKL